MPAPTPTSPEVLPQWRKRRRRFRPITRHRWQRTPARRRRDPIVRRDFALNLPAAELQELLSGIERMGEDALSHPGTAQAGLDGNEMTERTLAQG